jgi:hypothetical protein
MRSLYFVFFFYIISSYCNFLLAFRRRMCPIPIIIGDISWYCWICFVEIFLMISTMLESKFQCALVSFFSFFFSIISPCYNLYSSFNNFFNLLHFSSTTLNVIFSNLNIYQTVLFHKYFFYLCYLTIFFFQMVLISKNTPYIA